jgi:hypothetical protein
MSDTHRGTLWTIGHSTRPWDAFVALLREAGIEAVADVRRFAGSRRNPQFSGQDMGAALAVDGVRYVPMPALGGRRAPRPDSPNGAWRNAGFRGYADYMQTQEYLDARRQLQDLAQGARVAVMCAEAMWWQCHRSSSPTTSRRPAGPCCTCRRRAASRSIRTRPWRGSSMDACITAPPWTSRRSRRCSEQPRASQARR